MMMMMMSGVRPFCIVYSVFFIKSSHSSLSKFLFFCTRIVYAIRIRFSTSCPSHYRNSNMSRGVHPPEVMMHFHPVSDSPPIFEKISDSVENFQNFTFCRKISRFKFRISPPLFSLFQYISLLLRKLLFHPYFFNFPPFLEKITCFLHTF